MSGIESILVLYLIVVFAFDNTHGQGGPCTNQVSGPGPGICVPIKTCRTITELFDNSPRPLPISVADQVRKSHCGTFNNTHHVCCQQTEQTDLTRKRPSPEPFTSVQGGPCTTLQKEPGICVPVVRCGAVTQISNNYDQMQELHCGIFNDILHVCCEQFSITTGETAPPPSPPSPTPPPPEPKPFTPVEGGPCRNHLRDPGSDGICVQLKTCRTITDLFDNSPRPLPASVADQVRQSHCGTFNNTHYVCCDRNHVAAKPPVTSTNSNPIIRAGFEKSHGEVVAEITVLQQTACGMNDMHLFAEYNDQFVCLSNGLYAEVSEYPWMALLIYFDGVSRTLDCGGSLIHERYVLTAAHCIQVRRKRLVSVRLGEHDTETTRDCSLECRLTERCSPPIQEIDVEEAIYHHAYNPRTFSDDIGILRLASNAVIDTNVKPICLPLTSYAKFLFPENMIISGWGRMENGNKATILQKASVPLKSIEYCQEAHRFVRMTRNHLCAGGENEIDTCKGDSGGPLIGFAPYEKDNQRFIQYGVISAGSLSCGKKNSPGIYARVNAYLLWIVSNLNFTTSNAPAMVID